MKTSFKIVTEGQTREHSYFFDYEKTRVYNPTTSAYYLLVNQQISPRFFFETGIGSSFSYFNVQKVNSEVDFDIYFVYSRDYIQVPLRLSFEEKIANSKFSAGAQIGTLANFNVTEKIPYSQFYVSPERKNQDFFLQYESSFMAKYKISRHWYLEANIRYAFRFNTIHESKGKTSFDNISYSFDTKGNYYSFGGGIGYSFVQKKIKQKPE